MSAENGVLHQIDSEWEKLNAVIDSLGPRGLMLAADDGWAVKDHLIHIAAWEISLIALLQGADRAGAMGAPGLSDTDAINAAVWSAHKDESPEEALAHFRETHARLITVLSHLSDEELQLPYNHYQPNDPKPSPGGDQPVIDWVAGNTYGHYAEHIGWINHLIEARAAR
ncbi:MAG TPA: ClbS/DfsB family four-helix bundle protein [Candidatus Dormibacteraeota bacterium]|nr:ClbS/DfsB family four-helix bundle protein [Candidatus Dormibacteraeota bacterium]